MTSNELHFEVSDMITGLTAAILAPIVFPAAATLNHPVTKAILKEGIILSEKVQEATAQTEETIADLVAEAKAELIARREGETSSTLIGNTHNSRATEYIIDAFKDINTQVRQATNNMADLQLLLPLGLGAIALRQLLTKGLQIEEIPWYVLAWYAFDSFIKLNETPTSRSLE
ncbi:DUF5132 domain-containing protein [Gloeocapsopsis crepidinum]|uniref:DUF5132 domain-containing protein n=1 Tax=Gloeocapsopsis crepidinum TaxID=693223 RepID=UPI001D15BB08|nr:DUF5132 domain-containing protein [Gloeocapsopsis crepidinum]